MFCEKGGFGGEEDAELKELWRNGLLERLEGLVLLGLGPPAMTSFVLPLSQKWCRDKELGASRIERWEASESDGRWVSRAQHQHEAGSFFRDQGRRVERSLKE